MVHFRISLRIRTRSIISTNARRRGGPDVEVQAETESRDLGLQIERTTPDTEDQIPRVRREESSAVIPVSATASVAEASSTLTLTSSQSSSASAVSLISSPGSSTAAAPAPAPIPTSSAAPITASQADNIAMSFSKSKSNSSSAFFSSSSTAAAAAAAASSPLPRSRSAKILILSTASSDQASFIATACADNGPLGNSEAASDAADVMKTFGVGAEGDNGVHSSLDEGRTAMDLGIVLHFRVLGQLPVCFVTIPELEGGLESAPRLEGCLGDILPKYNDWPTGIIFLYSATETLEPAVVDALEVIVGGTEEMQQVMFVSTGWENLSAKELKEAELQQQLVRATLCARMNVQTLTRWRHDGSTSSARGVTYETILNDDAIRARNRSPNGMFLLPEAGTASRRWFPPWLKWLLSIILTLSFVMTAVGYIMAAVAAQQMGQKFSHVGQEFTRVVGLLAVDPQAAGVVLKEVLSGVLSGEELTHVAEEVNRMVGLLADDPKTAGVVLKEVLSGALEAEHWPAASKVNLWTQNEVVNVVMLQTDSVKLSDGIEGMARFLVELLKSLGDDREAVVRTLAGVLEKLEDDREALAGKATEIMYAVLGDSPEKAVLFWKDFLGGLFAGDATPGPAWLGGEGDGDGQGRGPNWEMEVLADVEDARSKSEAKMEQSEEIKSWVGGQGWQELLAQQGVESAKWLKELRDSQVRRDHDAAAGDARWRSGGWGHVPLALMIGLVAAVLFNRRAEGV